MPVTGAGGGISPEMRRQFEERERQIKLLQDELERVRGSSPQPMVIAMDYFFILKRDTVPEIVIWNRFLSN